MVLKDYQKDTLNVIKAFFSALDTKTPEEAYTEITESSLDMMKRLGKQRGYAKATLDTPTVAIKVPTGGGKTIIAAHAVKRIAECQDREYPFVIWFAPTDTIRRQTADALKKPKHPYRLALDEAFRGNVRIYDLDGRMVSERNLGYANEGEQVYTIGTEGMAKGMYLVNVIIGGHTAATKMMVR